MKKNKLVSLIGLASLFIGLSSCTKNNKNNNQSSSTTPTSISTSEDKKTDASVFDYKINSDNKSVTITGLKDANYTHIVVPDEIDGKKVTQISNESFQNNSNIKAFKINKYITKISGFNFLGSNNLEKIEVDSENETLKVENNCVISKKETKVGTGLYTLYFGLGLFDEENAVIPSNIDTIKNYAFCGARFKKTTIHSSVTSIVNTSFTYCSNLEDFIVDEGNVTYASVNHCLINKKSQLLLCGTINSVIPTTGVTAIWSNAFTGINIKELFIPSNINSFKMASGYSTNTSYCFKDSGIQKVTFDDNVNLDSSGFNSAFYDATNLEEINIPSGIDFDQASNWFDGCISLKKVSFISEINKNKVLSRMAFKNSLNKIDFIFGDKNLEWSEDDGYVIYNDSSNGKILKGYFGTDENVMLPEVTKIDYRAFYNSKVKNVTMPDSVTTIDSYVFGQSSVENIKFSSSLTSMGSNCFINCKNLKTINWPSSIKAIPLDTFFEANLELLVLKNNTLVTSNSLRSSNINELKIDGNNPNYIVSDDKLTLLSNDGKAAVASFSDENGSITIPDGVRTIGAYACYGRDAKKIILSDSVEKCEKCLFSYSNIETIEIKNPNLSFTKNTTSDTANSTFFKTNNLEEITFYGTLDQFKTAFGSTKDEYNKLISKSLTIKYKSSAEVETLDTTKTTDEIYA